MKKKARKSNATASSIAKKKKKPSAKGRVQAKKSGKTALTPRAEKKTPKKAKAATPVSKKKGPVAINSGKNGAGAVNGTIYDRQIFVRFETPALKQLVQDIAEKNGVSASAYAAYFAVKAAEEGKQIPAAKDAAKEPVEQAG